MDTPMDHMFEALHAKADQLRAERFLLTIW